MGLVAGGGQPTLVFRGDAVLPGVPALLASQLIEGEVLGRSREPGGGVVRHAAIGPGLQGADERFLDHIFGELQLMRAEVRGERGNEAGALLAKEMLGDLGGVHAETWEASSASLATVFRLRPVPVLAAGRTSFEDPRPSG